MISNIVWGIFCFLIIFWVLFDMIRRCYRWKIARKCTVIIKDLSGLEPEPSTIRSLLAYYEELKYRKMMIDEGHEAELGTFGADEYNGNAYQ